MHINRHVACSCMHTCTACRRSSCMWGGRAHATVACGASAVPFLHEWRALILRGNRTCIGKIVVTPTATYSRERALLAHATEGEGHAGGCSTLGRAHRRRCGTAVRADSAVRQARASGHLGSSPAHFNVDLYLLFKFINLWVLTTNLRIQIIGELNWLG